MRVMVTGSGGFIGRAVRDELTLRDWEFRSYDLHDGCDIRDVERLVDEASSCDSVIHLAGVLGTHELFDEPGLAVSVNVGGTLNVLEACRRVQCGYVGITMPQVFPSIYTATKIAATRLASAYHHSRDVPVSHVRAFNAFGPGQAHGEGHPQKIIPTFAVHGWSRQPMPIWGDGSQTVDLIHTGDLARMLVDATMYGNDETFDGGTGEPFSVRTVADMVATRTGSDVPHRFLPMRRGEVPTHIVAEGEGWDELGWRPTFDYDLLNAAIDSYRDHPTVR